MPNRLFSLRMAVCLGAACVALAGCGSAQRKAGEAYARYESAIAVNDLAAARQALQQAVAAKDDVAEYWSSLGKVHAATRNYGDAYYAFSRAYELDRSNADLIRALTELSLRTGDMMLAQKHAEELDVLVPGDRWVKLAKGYAAFTQKRYSDALRESDALLNNDAFDPMAVALRARTLMGNGSEDEAVGLLENQIRTQPADVGSLQLLARVYERRNDWKNVARVADRLFDLDPSDRPMALLSIQASFRSGNIPHARQLSYRLLKPDSDAALIEQVLGIWEDLWASPQRAADARALSSRASGLAQRVAYGAFLSRNGDPASAIKLVARDAGLPVSADNASANAVFADALARTGHLPEAKQRFDAVLDFDSGQSLALRGRADLMLRASKPAQALVDSQKLVTVLPDSAPDRLLLARCYAALQDARQVDRTLWQAFQEIPANERVFSALANSRRSNPEAIRAVQAEYNRQRDAKLNQGLL